ncbi:hypothetical protein [Zwartia sp.]|uniref:hypothetical protein n=1 Tax=Zwartia sp. TaxID=2978004 RepID=UPI00271D1DEF|nr:hypothetical protein [Zwartia sp.]MDO9025116.1 hypothetical protein [Zwartia sp.]
MTSTQYLSMWQEEIQEHAASGTFAQTLQTVFGEAKQPQLLNTFIDGLTRGDISVFPQIEILDNPSMQDHLGAYASSTQTIYLNSSILGQTSLLSEVLTHELGHYISDRFYTGQEHASDAVEFTQQLLGQDHALHLTQAQSHSEHQTGHLVIPGSQTSLDVLWFDTNLHINWAQAQLPMLNARAFDFIKDAQNDSDAFYAPIKSGIFSPYGLQTSSATHFDNNNIRGGLETLRKRWSDGVDQFDREEIRNGTYSGAGDNSRVGPDFVGTTAGIENLLYRFGQISHAIQDFYSHSNWLELIRADNGKWIGKQSLLDSGLDLPTQLNPSDYIPNANGVMVAMSGPDYDATFKRAGVGTYGLKSQVVNWWVTLDQTNWGKVFASPKALAGADDSVVTGLMTGAVNGAVYYDTDYSVALRAVDRTGIFDQEYFRGFSHGGLAGAVLGQWVSPLSKDKEDNGRFADKAVNKSLFEEAQVLADLQVRHDWDRMGNLIFKHHGVSGLQKFADFAVIESERNLYVSTYSQAGGRWNWSPISSENTEHVSSSIEPDIRYVQVFFDSAESNFTTTDNKTYLTQYEQDGRWIDSAAGLVSSHHAHNDEESEDVYKPADTQYAERGGRALWSTPLLESGHYLGTLHHVQLINTQARVYINHFDIGNDELRLIDGAGQLIEVVDIDHGDFDQLRESLLQKYNILINARPESQTLTQTKIILTAKAIGPVLLQASDFFGDQDSVLATGHNPLNNQYSALSFVSHDETLSWLRLREDGFLEISDLSQVPRGTYEVYVNVSDGAAMLEGAMITLAIDPLVSIGDHTFKPDTPLEVTFRTAGSGAISIYGQVYDDAGRAVSIMQHLALRIGDAAGTPQGVDADVMFSNLADPASHGVMKFFSYAHDSDTMTMLDLVEIGQDRFALKSQDLVIAELAVGRQPSIFPYIDELYIPALDDMMLGIPLVPQTGFAEPKIPGQNYQVTLDTIASRESSLDGEFGLFLGDLQTGYIVDAATGIQLEDAILDVDHISDYAVFKTSVARDGQKYDSVSFELDAELNLNNLALLPYYIVQLPDGKELFLGNSIGTRDGVSHISRIGQNAFGVEDLVGGDYDFDDIVVNISSFAITGFA